MCFKPTICKLVKHPDSVPIPIAIGTIGSYRNYWEQDFAVVHCGLDPQSCFCIYLRLRVKPAMNCVDGEKIST